MQWPRRSSIFYAPWVILGESFATTSNKFTSTLSLTRHQQSTPLNIVSIEALHYHSGQPWKTNHAVGSRYIAVSSASNPCLTALLFRGRPVDLGGPSCRRLALRGCRFRRPWARCAIKGQMCRFVSGPFTRDGSFKK